MNSEHWINVKNELPEEKVNVLAFVNWECNKRIVIASVSFCNDYPGGKLYPVWVTLGLSGYCEAQDITHWRPLPKYPL